MRDSIVAGLEVGTSKVCVAVAVQRGTEAVKLLGIGETPAQFSRDGVVDEDLAGRCILEALVDAERKTDVMIRSVRLALGGAYEGERRHTGGAGLGSSETCWFDPTHGVLQATGVHRMEAGEKAHAIDSYSHQIAWRTRCIQKLGLSVDDVVLLPAASATAVLDEQARQRGALVIDFGAGRIAYAAYHDGHLFRTGCLPFGHRKAADGRHSPLQLALALSKASRFGAGAPAESYAGGVHLTGGGAMDPFVQPPARAHFAASESSVTLAHASGVSGEPSLVENPRYASVIGLVKAAVRRNTCSLVTA